MPRKRHGRPATMIPLLPRYHRSTQVQENTRSSPGALCQLIRARWYDPSTGGWLTQDPVGYHDSSNLYAFSAADPINYSDPLGLALYAFDGTWNDRDDPTQALTNVPKLFAVYNGSKQYEVGVGTRWYSKWLGGATGLGVSSRVNHAYKRLKENYAAGDLDIDIIGFSRGAAEALQFANLINEKGVPDGHGGTVIPDIRFLGVFDTVGSIGIAGTNLNPGFNLTLPENVETARLAIAANEYRGTFPLSHLSNPLCPDRRVIEKPFRGAHSDNGGGYNDDPTLSRLALNWMWDEMKKAGLPVKQLPPAERNTSGPGTVHQSYDSWKYTPTRIRLWWDELNNRPPQRKEYFPPCSVDDWNE